MDCTSSGLSLMMKFTEALLWSLDEFPNCLEVYIFRQPSESRPDGSEPLFVNIAARITKDSLMRL